MAKAKHKHNYKPCILKSVKMHRDRMVLMKVAYCEFCGKVNRYEHLGDVIVMHKEYKSTNDLEFLNENSNTVIFEVDNPCDTKYVSVP